MSVSDRAPVIMVHGAFVGGWSFETFRQPFEAAGYPCLAPDLPGHGAGARGADVAGRSIDDYVKAIVALIQAQPQPPVLIGHSMGGLVSMIAAAKARVRSLIVLAPSPPWGVMGSTMEEAASAITLHALGPFWLQSIEPDYAAARLYSLNRMDKPARKAAFARMSRESGRALWEVLNWWLDPFMTTQVSAGRIKAPVLALAGEKDVIHPAGTVSQTARKLGAEFRAFPGMSHWLVGEPGWEQVAEACLEWLARQQAPQPASLMAPPLSQGQKG
ncbi:MAG: alpha/beta hydrolase [Caulobacteraceae bacterium]|nr:alpha/beta hydrolase [Caulobacteraceae bacterium]